MSIYEPPQEALIYEGDYNSPFKKPESGLSAAFSDVAGSAQKYRVIVKGYDVQSATPQDIADMVAETASDENLQDDPDIHAVASALHAVMQQEYEADLKSGHGPAAPFNALPMIITLHKPGKFQSADDILTSLSQDERSAYQQDVESLTPQTV